MKRILSLISTLLLLALACSFGATATSIPTVPPSQSPSLQSPPPPTGQHPCGDGLCDAAEQADPSLCPSDCKDQPATPIASGTLVATTPPTQVVETLPTELTFIPDPGIRIKMAVQPAPVVAPDGTIYVFYSTQSTLPNEPGSNKVAHSTDGLSFTETGLDPNRVSVINPFATQLPDGTWRIYLFNPSTGVMTSRSAPDGIHFTADEGIRYTAPSGHPPIGIWDEYVNLAGEVILVYVAPIGVNSPDHHMRRAVSTDGGKTFTFHSDNVLGDRGGGELNTHVDPKFLLLPDGRARLFTMVQGNVVLPGQRACCTIYSFTTADG
ncbi:MAG: hypothetical protein AB1649_33655, partial [Chloroflexota bacterium]